jgi:cytochrome c-type biogenesis protein CcmH
MRAFAALLGFLLLAVSAGAVEPNEMLKDPALEARAREVSKALRCVQCQNESIDESNAEIAHDMRVLVRQRIMAGDSNEQIIAYMTSRYGDYVRLMPRFMPTTLLLWLGPLAILLLGGVVVARRIRNAPAAPAPLSEEERAALEALQARGENT